MRYVSTRNKSEHVSSAQTIERGLSVDGGLFVPEILPRLPKGAIGELRGMNYRQRAVYVMKLFLEDYTVAELTDFTNRAYGPEGFDTPKVAPVRKLPHHRPG